MQFAGEWAFVKGQNQNHGSVLKNFRKQNFSKYHFIKCLVMKIKKYYLSLFHKKVR